MYDLISDYGDLKGLFKRIFKKTNNQTLPDMSDEELVHEYAAKVSKGEITFDKVRPLLEQQGIDETRVTQIVRKVDDEIQAALLTQSTTSSLEKVIRFGI